MDSTFPVSAELRAQIEAQTTREDAELLFAYLAKNPDDIPANNALLWKCVHASDYEDRGMWGPLGGKGGTVSRDWLDEWKRLNAGGVSEFGLMTIVSPPDAES